MVYNVEEGKRYRVIHDSEENFCRGDIVVALEEGDNIPYCILESNYIKDTDVEDYEPEEKCFMLNLEELEEIKEGE